MVTGLGEKSCKGIMDGLRKFIEVDNHQTVNVGGFSQGTKAVQVLKPRFTDDFPEAVIREGAQKWAHDAPIWRPSDGDHTELERWEPGLICVLSIHLPGNRRTNLGNPL